MYVKSRIKVVTILMSNKKHNIYSIGALQAWKGTYV